MTAEVLRVHDTTLPHLDPIEKVILDELVQMGRAVIISEDQIARSQCNNEGSHVTAILQ